MIIRTFMLILSCSTMIPNIAKSQDAPIIGGGFAPCSTLLERKAFYIDQANMQWYLGYLSGAAMMAEAMNRTRSDHHKLPSNLMKPSLRLLVEDAEHRCKNEPDKLLHEIGTDVIVMMQK